MNSFVLKCPGREQLSGKLLAVVASALLSTATLAEQVTESLGGDVFVSGSSPSMSNDAPRDVFAAGFSPTVDANVAGDLHMAGFNVNARGRVAQDLYAAGSSIAVQSTVDQDVTAAGFSVHLTKDGSVGGNVRIAAGTTNIESPVAGSLRVSAGEIKLDAPVNGDVKLTAGDISFGPQARIAGKLVYAARKKIDVPASVITPERVRYTAISGDVVGDVGDTIKDAVPSPWAAFVALVGGFLVTLTFYLVVSVLFQSFAPDTVARLRGIAGGHLGKALLLGFIGLATLVGLVPVSLIIIVGIPVIPVVLLAIVVAWILGYLLGAYALAMRVAEAFNLAVTSPVAKLLTVALGITVLAILNFIPFVGWIFNLAVMLLGLGAITAVIMDRLNWAMPDTTHTPHGASPGATVPQV